MIDIFKKKFGAKREEKSLLTEKPAQSSFTLIQAKTQLNLAKRNNINLIQVELRRLRNPEGMTEESIEMSKQIVKNAYYALNVIQWVEQAITDRSSYNQLARGMNGITKGVQLFNKYDSKEEKPKTLKFIRTTSKLEGSRSKEGRTLNKMESAYDKVLPMGVAVDDDIVERLINGEQIENCVKKSMGIPDEYKHIDIDFSDLGDLAEGNSEFDFNNGVFFSDDDLSDLNL